MKSIVNKITAKSEEKLRETWTVVTNSKEKHSKIYQCLWKTNPSKKWENEDMNTTSMIKTNNKKSTNKDT